MTLLLDVPFDQKDEAKQMGAKWNADKKKWYVNNREEYHKFAKWFSQDGELELIICDHLYIIEAFHKCFKCGKNTKVIGFGIENYIILDLEEFLDDGDISEIDEGIAEHHDGEINIAYQIEPLPKKILEYIQGKYNYKMTYSKFAGTTYPANCCDHCDTLQGDHYLFSDAGGPFFLDSKQKISDLKLCKIHLPFDLAVIAIVGWSSEDHLIKELGQISAANLDF